MDDATTTAPAEQPAGGEVTPQPAAPTEAAESQAQETQPDPQGEPAEAPTDEHLTWLKNKGIDPGDPDAVQKAADAWRKAEQEFHKGRQESKSQLKEDATEVVETNVDDPNAARLQKLEVKQSISDFYLENPGARELDGKMAEILRSKPHLLGDMDSLYALARADRTKSEIEAAEKRGREAAKADISRQSVAATPKGNASSAVEPDPDEAGRQAFRKEMGLST